MERFSGNKPTAKPAKVIKPDPSLQQKTGRGDVCPDSLKQAEKVMNKGSENFWPLGEDLTAQLENALEQARTQDDDDDPVQALQKIVEIIMQVKANGSMFDCALAGKLAHTTLHLAETTKELDADLLEIMTLFQKALRLIVKNKIDKDGGEIGAALHTELLKAGERYLAKRSGAA